VVSNCRSRNERNVQQLQEQEGKELPTAVGEGKKKMSASVEAGR
jgi:hypothetical protein